MKNWTLRFAVACFVGLMALGFASCNKETETIATIIVRNDLGAAVPGATVRLYGNPSGTGNTIGEIRIDTVGTTNATGKVTFNLSDFYKEGQAGFMVLDIEAQKGALYGIGIIKVEEEATNEEAVEITD